MGFTRGTGSRIAQTVAGVLGLSLGVIAHADTATATSESTEDQIPEVVVTATKRVSTVQETSASITAISAEDIADRGLVDFNSLAQSVAGISMRTAGPGQTEFEMRGLSSAGGNTSQVGFYFDETPLSSPASAQVGKVVVDPNLYDVSRVEVLRGPQGTLYGSSSMGGTVKIVPAPPELDTFNASGEDVISYTASGGGVNHRESGMVNLPMGSTAAIRIVGSIDSESGWIKRLVIQNGAVLADSGVFPDVSRPANFYTAPLQEEIDGANSTTVDSVRIEGLWKPIDSLTVTPMVMWQLTQQDAPNAVDVNGDPTNPTVPSTNAHWEIYDAPEPQRDQLTLGSLKIEGQLEGFSVTSATGQWTRGILISQDGSEENAAAFTPGGPYNPPAGIGPTGPAPNGPAVTEKDFTRQFTEELRATSTGSGRFQWILGYFYQDLYSEWDMWSIVPEAPVAITGGPNVYVDYQPQKIIQNSEFGEVSWRFTDQFKATAGVRHYHYVLGQTNEEFGAFTVNSYLGNSVPYDTSAHNSASGTNPKVDLTYELSKELLIYATAAKGFRLGGVNQPIPVASTTSTNSVLAGNECGLQQKLLLIPASACNPSLLLQAPATFANDQVWNYEVGEKATLFDRRLTLNLSGYFERWEHPQIATNLAGFGITVNGGEAQIFGFEGEMQTLLAREWDFTLNAGYTNAKFVESSAITGYPDGYAVSDIPKVTAAANIRWRHALTDDLGLIGSLEGDYVGNRTDAPYGETITLININQYLLHLPAYGLMNLRFGFTGPQWSATLFVNNLTNKEALLDPQPQINLQTSAFVRYLVNPPLTGGLDVTYKFR